MTRTVTREILDHLPAADPAAQASRRDLRVLNRVMGSPRWFQRTLCQHLRQGERVLELGAGDGHLASLAPAGVVWDAVDRDERPAGWRGREWHRQDLRAFSAWSEYDVLVGNLIFHHLTQTELQLVGAHCRHLRLILACEPHRSWGARLGFALLCPIIGANAVTRHDGRVSIAAGFRGSELPQALGLAHWRWQIRGSGRGTQRLVGQRTA